MRMQKIALALGGGAAKGWAHIGFLRALNEAGIHPDIITGTSMGAVSGGCWAAGKLDALEDFARSLTPRRVFSFMDISLSGSGLINGGRLGTELEKHLGEGDIVDLSIPFCCMATELDNGNEIWLTQGRLATALQASYALPGIFRPVAIDGRWLVDGALVNPVPVSAARALGGDYVIAVSLSTQGVGHGTVISGLTPARMATDLDVHNNVESNLANESEQQTSGSVKRRLRRQIIGSGEGAPGITSVMMQSYNIIQDRIARSRLAGDPPDLLIKPKVHDIGLFDFHRADEAIKAGYDAAQPAIAQLVQEPDLSTA
ncbi:MAG: patatin-like phospholipase family protein [Pseudomonadota bacterium]